jgi:hypothetical protein
MRLDDFFHTFRFVLFLQSDGFISNESGYPPLAYYSLSEAATPGSIVLAKGPQTIYYQRYVCPTNHHAIAPTSRDEGPRTEDRLRYLAALIGSGNSIRFDAEEERTIVWRSREALESESRGLKEDILQRYSELIKILIGKNLLTAKEVSVLPKPTIKLQIHDLRIKKKP